MASSEGVLRLAGLARLSGRHAIALVGWPALLGGLLPRVLMQAAFFTLIGRLVAGEAGERHAFTGAVGQVMTIATIAFAVDVVLPDKTDGTLYRVRLGDLPVLVVALTRSWVYLVEGLASWLVATAVLGPVFVGVDATVRLLGAAGIYALAAVSTLALGLAGAASAVGRRSDVVISNALMYLVLVCGGVVVPEGRSPVLDAVGQVLPLRHALGAARAWLDGRFDAGALAQEAVVAAGWLAVAALAFAVQDRRARVHARDEYI